MHHTHTYTHTHTYIHTHTCIHTLTYTHPHTHIHAHTHTPTHTHTRTCTHALVAGCLEFHLWTYRCTIYLRPIYRSASDINLKLKEGATLLSADMKRELRRQQWEKEAEELVNGPVHYANVQFDGELHLLQLLMDLCVTND